MPTLPKWAGGTAKGFEPVRRQHKKTDTDLRRAARQVYPCHLEVFDVARVDLVERAIVIRLVAAVVSQPVVRSLLGGLQAIAGHARRAGIADKMPARGR